MVTIESMAELLAADFPWMNRSDLIHAARILVTELTRSGGDFEYAMERLQIFLELEYKVATSWAVNMLQGAENVMR